LDETGCTVGETKRRRGELYLHRDPSGREQTEYSARRRAGVDIVDRSVLYVGYRGFSDHLTAKPRAVAANSYLL